MELLEAIRKRGWLLPGAKSKLAYELSTGGTRALARRGVDIAAARESRRRFATACLDWTERRPHLGGALGARILDALCGKGYVRRGRRGGTCRSSSRSRGGSRGSPS